MDLQSRYVHKLLLGIAIVLVLTAASVLVLRRDPDEPSPVATLTPIPTLLVAQISPISTVPADDTRMIPATTTPAPPTPRPSAPTSTATVQRKRAVLVATLRRDGHDHLYTFQTGVSEPQPLTAGAWDDRDPAWSPDGQRLAFASNRSGNWEIYLLDPLTGQTQQITEDKSYDAAPAWSPDGQRLAFESYRSGNLDIWLLDLAGSPLRQLTNDPAADVAPAWSPDDQSIAFVSWRFGNRELLTLNPEQPEPVTRLTASDTLQEDWPAWSPDGHNLAYEERSTGYDLIYLVPFSPGTSGALTPGMPYLAAHGRRPAWLLDGRLVYSQVQTEGQAIMTDGTGSTAGLYLGRESIGRLSATRREWPDAWQAPCPKPVNQSVPAGDIPCALAATPLPPTALAGLSNPQARLVSLTGVKPWGLKLSDQVAGSFQTLRQRVAVASGLDFLGILDSAWTDPRAPVAPGLPIQSWYQTGRAFAIRQQENRSAQLPPRLEVVREPSGFQVYWRLWLRAAAQDGTQGEPLRERPWDFGTRANGLTDPASGEGTFRATIPPGYYVDLTELTADDGWERQPAGDNWRSFWPAINFWTFIRRDHLTWRQAILELYSPQEVESIFGPG